MLDVNYLEAHTNEVIERLNTRGTNYRPLVEEIVHLNKNRKMNLLKVERLRAQKNQATNDIRNLIHNISARSKGSFKLELEEIKQKINRFDSEIQTISKKLEIINQELRIKNSYLPNIPADDVPLGKNDSENVEIKNVNSQLINHQKTLPHWEIAKKLCWADFELGVKMSGSRFLVYCGLGAKMIRVLSDILVDLHLQNGFIEYNIPLIVNKTTMEGTGQLPKFAEEAYRTDNQYLIPTGEVPLANFVANEILDCQQLPLNLTASSPCFRQEAGSAGRDTRGMIRLHQFNKVELVKIVTPENSNREFQNLITEVEKSLDLFKLPYRIVNLSTGDLGFSATKTYDFEVWFPHQQKYREISSCSLCGDFQARNMQARYRDENGKTQFVHTLNGSALAIDRLFAAILENYWDGEKLILPKVLQPYFNNQKYLK